MTNIEIKYPVLIIKDNDNNLYGFSKNLGLISKGGDSFYNKPFKLIDQDGIIFELNESQNIGSAPFLKSLKYFQPMEQIELNFEEVGKISLVDFKNLVLKHIKVKPNRWLPLGTIEMIEEWVNEKETISDLIKMFK